MTQVEERPQAVLVGVRFEGSSSEGVERDLDELEELLATAGGESVARVVQRREHPDVATYVGKGKVEELRDSVRAAGADLVVFDDELSPTQVRNLEKELRVPVQDRTAIILDIFAQHAVSDEGKLQVELALARYRLPRLRGQGVSMSQQSGRVGVRQGFGETRLEIDRRRLLERVRRLERELKELSGRRKVQRSAAKRSGMPQVALVGYTSAGKSTLLRQLTGSDVLVSAQLFSTLDPRTRRLSLEGGREVLLSDTVGFVAKLPHQLVEAFRSTLEVATDADLLVHVVDVSSSDPEQQVRTVREVLGSIGASDVPELLVLNKVDVAHEGQVKEMLQAHPGAVAISALDGTGMETLLAQLQERLPHGERLEVLVPWEQGELLAALRRDGRILGEEDDEAGAHLDVEVPPHLLARVRPLEESGAHSS